MIKCFIIISRKGAKLRFLQLLKRHDTLHIEIENADFETTLHTTLYSGSGDIKTKSDSFPSGLEPLLRAHLFEIFKDCQNTGLIIYQHDETIFELCRSVILSSQLPYAISVANSGAFHWKQQHFVATARYRFCFDEGVYITWQKKYVYQCEWINLGNPSDSFLENLTACTNRNLLTTFSESKRKKPNKFSVLLVSYFMPPAQTVAIQRIDYWYRLLPKLAEADKKTIDISVVTACNSFENDNKYIVVADTDDIGCKSEQHDDLVRNLADANVNYFSARWSGHVQNFFENNDDAYYDCVILSGNPFYYFDLGEYFKQKFQSKIILDFRDPFANNPRFKYTPEHKQLVLDLEEEYLKYADHILSVNEFCLDQIGKRNKENGTVVANGFDERVVNRVKPRQLRSKDKVINFVYTGSFYADRKPDKFLRLLNPDHHRLIHIGRTRAADEHLDEYPCLDRYGLMSYENVIGYCHNMSAGIIFTSGAEFEQTTKIFDYIACNIDIVIVTNGKVKTGELHNLTKDMPGVYWMQNKPKQIKDFLKVYKPRKRKRKNRDYYSRLRQTEKLYKLIIGKSSGAG